MASRQWCSAAVITSCRSQHRQGSICSAWKSGCVICGCLWMRLGYWWGWEGGWCCVIKYHSKIGRSWLKMMQLWGQFRDWRATGPADVALGWWFKLNYSKFCWDIRKNFFTARVIAHWKRLPREAAEIPKTWWDIAPSNPLSPPLLSAEGLDQTSPRGAFQPQLSVVQYYTLLILYASICSFISVEFDDKKPHKHVLHSQNLLGGM